jgi:hypothetical protein
MEIMSFVEKCMELEVIMLSKISQAQKAKYHIFSLICGTYTQTYTQNNDDDNNNKNGT